MFKFFLKRTSAKILAVICFFLIIISLFICWGWYVKQINKAWGFYYVHKGDKFYHQHKMQKAIENYKIGLKKFPQHSIARCNLANIYVMYEDYYSAVNEYDQALKYSPNFNVCRMNYGIILAEKFADYDKAIQEYMAITKSHPILVYIPFIYNNLRSNKENKGLAYYNMGLAYRGKSLLLGEKTLVSNQYLQSAKEAYLKSVKILKKNYEAHYNLALTNHLLGDYKNAGLEYCKAIKLKPLEYDAHYNLALLLRHLDLYQNALDELEKASLVADNSIDIATTRYVFDVLNDVSRLIINEEGGYKYLKERIGDPHINGAVTLVNGKIVVTKELDRAIYDNMKKCNTKKYFDEM